MQRWLAYCFARSPSRNSLSRKGCRVGLRIVLFEDCSAVDLSTSEIRHSLNDPERRNAADGICGDAPCPRGLHQADALGNLPRERKDGEDERDEE